VSTEASKLFGQDAEILMTIDEATLSWERLEFARIKIRLPIGTNQNVQRI